MVHNCLISRSAAYTNTPGKSLGADEARILSWMASIFHRFWRRWSIWSTWFPVVIYYDIYIYKYYELLWHILIHWNPLKSLSCFRKSQSESNLGFRSTVNYGQLPRRRASKAIKAWLSKFAKTSGDCPNWRTRSCFAQWWQMVAEHPDWFVDQKYILYEFPITIHIYIENSVLILNPIISLFHLFSLWVSISSPLHKSTINVKWLGAWPTASGFSGPLSGDKTQPPKGGRATRALENLDHVARLSSCLRMLQRSPSWAQGGVRPGFNVHIYFVTWSKYIKILHGWNMGMVSKHWKNDW